MMIMNDDTTQNGYFSSSSDLKREKRLLHFCKKGKSIHSKKKIGRAEVRKNLTPNIVELLLSKNSV